MADEDRPAGTGITRAQALSFAEMLLGQDKAAPNNYVWALLGWNETPIFEDIWAVREPWCAQDGIGKSRRRMRNLASLLVSVGMSLAGQIREAEEQESATGTAAPASAPKAGA